MQYILLHHCLKGINNLGKVMQCLFLFETSFLLDLVFKSTTVAKFVYEIHIVGCAQHFHKPYNIWIALYLSKRFDLVNRKLLQFWHHAKFLKLNSLHSKYFIRFLVHGSVHLTVCARALFLQEVFR
jgi:hypothetical protein